VGLGVAKASSFAKASAYAMPTADETADKTTDRSENYFPIRMLRVFRMLKNTSAVTSRVRQPPDERGTAFLGLAKAVSHGIPLATAPKKSLPSVRSVPL